MKEQRTGMWPDNKDNNFAFVRGAEGELRVKVLDTGGVRFPRPSLGARSIQFPDGSYFIIAAGAAR